MITNLKQAFDNRILYATSSSTEIHNCSYASLIHTYLLSGEFKFYGGAKYLFCNDEQVVINMYRENENLSLVDNIHDKNWDSEEKLIYEKYINCKRYESLDGTNLCLIGTQWANSNIFHLLFDSIGKISILSKFYDPKDLVFLIPEGVGIF
jgi:hypothetical protein